MVQVNLVEPATSDSEHRGGVGDLAVGSPHRRPLQLGEHGVLGSGLVHVNAEKGGPDTPFELVAAERSFLADDQVDLPARRRVDQVELIAVEERLPGRERR